MPGKSKHRWGPAESKLTPEVAKKILDYVKVGNFQKVAAQAAGISDRTLREWIEQGPKQRDGHPMKEFARDLAKARAEAEAQGITRITAAAKDDWKAMAWRLERMHPKRYGLKVRVEVERELDAMLDKLQRHLPPEINELVLQALAADDDAEAMRALPAGAGEAGEALEGEFLDAE